MEKVPEDLSWHHVFLFKKTFSKFQQEICIIIFRDIAGLENFLFLLADHNPELPWVICTIVNRRNWVWSPANIKGANKYAKIYVGRSWTLHNLLNCAHTLCMNYVTNTFLLVRSSVLSKQLLCFGQGQGQKSKQKHTTKNFDEFHNHSPLLTMFALVLHLNCTVLSQSELRNFSSILL